MFRPLGREQIRGVVDIQIGHVQRIALKNHNLALEVTNDARDWLAERGYDPIFGARPLKRVIQREVTNKLAEEILSGWIEDGESITIDAAPDGSGLVFEMSGERGGGRRRGRGSDVWGVGGGW